MDFILYLMCYIKQEKKNNVNWREKVWNFLKFYNTDFNFVKDMPAELDLW